jgi:glutamyl-tRNA synthetase
MFDDLYQPTEYAWGNINDVATVKDIVNNYIDNFYDESDDKETWFNKVKELTESLDGFTSDMKAYKENPDIYKGNVADVSTAIRVAITSRDQTPDLYEILKLLGKERIKSRINSL